MPLFGNGTRRNGEPFSMAILNYQELDDLYNNGIFKLTLTDPSGNTHTIFIVAAESHDAAIERITNNNPGADITLSEEGPH